MKTIDSTQLDNVVGGQDAGTTSTTVTKEDGSVFRNGKFLGCALPSVWSPSAARCTPSGNDIPFPGN